MPLTMANPGECYTIRKVGGKEETRRFLENLGFVVGGNVTVVSEIDGNLIVWRPDCFPEKSHEAQ